jgi:hypothetical protein
MFEESGKHILFEAECGGNFKALSGSRPSRSQPEPPMCHIGRASAKNTRENTRRDVIDH